MSSHKTMLMIIMRKYNNDVAVNIIILVLLLVIELLVTLSVVFLCLISHSR